MTVTVFEAAKIITMDRNRPEATHVAVRDGIVLATGGADCGEGWGPVRRDDRFRGQVMMPGLIEAHAHVMAGGIWQLTYCGHYPRTDPDGKVWDGVPTNEALVERLQGVERGMDDPDAPVRAWGFEPNFVPGDRLSRIELDRVSTARPVVVMHSNGHLLTANTKALERAGMAQGSNIEGVMKGPDGLPNGELQEFAAMGPVMQATGISFGELSNGSDALRAYVRIARRCGVTTVADLFSDLDAGEVDMLLQATAEPSFPARYVPIMNAMRGDPGDEAERALALRARSTDTLRLGRAKLFTDGAIQGFTAKLLPPGYFKGPDHGIWNMEIDHFRAAVMALHKAGVKTHVHTNGDAASAMGADIFAEAMQWHPAGDLRHSFEHVQLADRAQFQRLRNLGICVNLFANHVHYFGDVHWTKTLGPDRACRMNACRDALEVFGGNFAIHSDAPVTPMAPLFTAWCAVNRLTEGGRQLGTSQQIPVEDALRCITLGAAYVLGLDHEVGSIATGKKADFCVLEEDPLAVDPVALKDVPVAATVFGGTVTEAP
ncbi:MAG: amidohydrolase [Pseudomonadota bacterium]